MQKYIDKSPECTHPATVANLCIIINCDHRRHRSMADDRHWWPATAAGTGNQNTLPDVNKLWCGCHSSMSQCSFWSAWFRSLFAVTLGSASSIVFFNWTQHPVTSCSARSHWLCWLEVDIKHFWYLQSAFFSRLTPHSLTVWGLTRLNQSVR